jgi:hypothetical protein
VERAFVGHLVNAADPTFVLDESAVPLSSTTPADVREPIASSCTANPFNADGAACQGGAVGTPFFLSTDGTSPGPLSLFANAYQSSTPATGTATAVTGTTATISGAVDPDGAVVSVAFQFGTTTAYTQSTSAQKLAPDGSQAFSAALTGLPAGTVIHYRAIAVTDFGTLVGADATLTTAATPPPSPTPGATPKPGRASLGHLTVSHRKVTVPVSCGGATSCQVSLRLTVHETLRHHRIVAVSAASPKKPRLTHRTVLVGRRIATIPAGHRVKLKVSLNRTGRHLLKARHHFKATLTVRQRRGHKTTVVAHRKVRFAQHHKHKHHH